MMEKTDTQNKKVQKSKFCFLPLTSRFLLKKEGQVAVILILVTAVALIFYAISLNLGRISQTKVATTIAADTGASLLGSYMASQGQSVFKTSLGGKTKVCGWTGLMASVLAAIIVIVAVVASVWTGGSSLSLLSYAAIVLALGAVAIQAAVIQPGITDAWNAIIKHSMDNKDAFTEQGVQAALSGAVTDSVQVADLNDFDGDRVWGLDVNGQPLDKVSRSGFYYRQMRINMILLPPVNSIADFLNELRNFLTDGGDGWGIYDKTVPKCDPFVANSECDSCCVPVNDAAGNPIVPRIRPLSCPDDATTLARCQANSPYGAAYPWVYDAYRGDPTNAFVSFQEQLGRDDEHQLFEKNPVDPNGLQTAVLPSPPPLPPTNFKLKDATAYYPNPPENRAGVFPFFYKIADWGVNLQSPPLVTNDAFNPQCNWCDARGGTTCDATATYPPEFPQLNLPVDPTTLTYNTTYCVDGTNPNPGWPPLAVDLVRLPDPADLFFVSHPHPPALGKIEANIDQCAQNSRDNRAMGFWKRGGDRFCSFGGDAYPYWGECPKDGLIDPVTGASINSGCIDPKTGVDPGCACGEAGAMPADNWPDDLMDDLVYGLDDFIKWATDFLAKDATTLSKEFKNWYPDASVWIEPGASTDPSVGSGATVGGPLYCYMCDLKDGALWAWYKDIQEIRKRLEAWRDTSFAGTTCTEVWCVPGAGCPGGKDAPAINNPPIGLYDWGDEASTFDSNGNGVRGDIEDVAACLRWNIEDQAGTVGAPWIGNDGKFNGCLERCNDILNPVFDAATMGSLAKNANEVCSALPRSLVPGFDNLVFTPANVSLVSHCSSTCDPCLTACAGITDAALKAACEAACVCGSCACTDGVCLSTQAVSPAAVGSCGNAGFMNSLDQSHREAQNQVAKFKQRYNFLKGRLDEMNKLISILQAAENKFSGFLTCPDGAACKLIKARIDADNQVTGLPYHAVYGWQSEPERGQPSGSGKWHLVRSDARIPARCDNDCPAWAPNGNQTQDGVDGDPKWPWVHTYTKSWGTKRCYELAGTDGMVKVRVSRYDETGTFSTLLFPNAVEIWKPTFSRGDRPLTADPGTLGDLCRSSMVPDPCPGPGPCPPASPGSYYYGAFILNKRDDNPLCWDLANKLLASGVTSEACAQYYFHGGNPEGMDFQFVRCPAF